MHFPGPNPNGDDERPPHPITRWRVDATSLVYAVLDAADRIQAARTRDGHPLIRDDRAWRLLCLVERSNYWFSISHAARRLGLPRQSVHRMAQRLEREGFIRLLPNGRDRRLLHIELTSLARAEIAGAQAELAGWILDIANGLDRRELRTACRIVRAVEQGILRWMGDRLGPPLTD
jgi:DNA-binding MarR family transcriptional regulator